MDMDSAVAFVAANLTAFAAAYPDPEKLRDALRDRLNDNADAAVLDGVREEVAKLNRNGVLGVYFSADEWDNGWFINTTGDLILDDGTTDDGAVDVYHLNDRFGEAFGTVGSSAGVLVDLTTNKVEFDDYGDSNLLEPFMAKIAARAQ